MTKKITTDYVLSSMIVLLFVAGFGVIFEVYWLTLPFAFYLSGVIVGNLNGEDMDNKKEK